jgi:hypothetical protein
LLHLGEATLLTAAVRVGSTRLIDNVILEVRGQTSVWPRPTDQKGDLR